MGSGEDLASDKDSEVREWLRPALQGFVQEAEKAIEKIQSLRTTSGQDSPKHTRAFESKLALLQARWEQIQDALERFIDPPVSA